MTVFLIFGLIVVSPLRAGGPQPLGNPANTGNIQNPVEQLSPDWRYSSNAYNIWQCTHDGTYEEYQAGGGVEHPDNCTYNPYVSEHCIWDVDDHSGSSDWGYLNSGISVVYKQCYIADDADNFGGDNKIFDVKVWAPNKSLIIKMVDSLGNNYNPIPIIDGSGWSWIICARENIAGPFNTIPNSNGGQGLRVDGNLTVTATKKVNNVVIYFSAWGWVREFTSLKNC